MYLISRLSFQLTPFAEEASEVNSAATEATSTSLSPSFLPASAARRLLCRPASVAGCRKVARLTGCRVIRLDARVRERGAEGGRGGRSERREIKGRHDADASLFTRERSLSLSLLRESRARTRVSLSWRVARDFLKIDSRLSISPLSLSPHSPLFSSFSLTQRRYTHTHADSRSQATRDAE